MATIKRRSREWIGQLIAKALQTLFRLLETPAGLVDKH